MRIHTGEKPHICSKSFTKAITLRNHNQNFHDSAPEPYICEICNAGFVTQSNLKLHFHLLHSDEKPYVCEICNMAFAFKSPLVRHMFVHTGKKAFYLQHLVKCFSDKNVT